MATLIYSPGIQVVIDTASNGLIDVSDDIEKWNLEITGSAAGGVFSCVLINHRNKYDGVFTPNDRIVVRLKRIKWLQNMAGYLTGVPFFSVFPRSVNLLAHTSFKRLQYHFFDKGSMAVYQLLNSSGHGEESAAQSDAGLKGKAISLLTEVADWPSQNIHIGEVPHDWFETVSDLYNKTVERVGVAKQSVGAAPTIKGVSKVADGDISIATGIVGTGGFPVNSGRGGVLTVPEGGSGLMTLTGESVITPADPWYLAMRWPYAAAGANGDPESVWTPAEETAARDWWTNRKILVYNSRNNLAFVGRAADWGPNANITPKREIDMSQHAMVDVLNAVPEDVFDIRFAPEGAALGPYGQGTEVKEIGRPRSAAARPKDDTPGPAMLPSGSSPSNSDFAWGGYENGTIPEDKLVVVTAVDGASRTPMVHPWAAMAFEMMVKEAAAQGVIIGAYSAYRSLANTPNQPNAAGAGTSVHGWGFAIDINGWEQSPGVDWARANGHSFGWVFPYDDPPSSSYTEYNHMEYWAAVGAASAPTGATGPSGPAAGQGTAGSSSQPKATPFNAFNWYPQPSLESDILYGSRALLNDEPILPYIEIIMNASMRSICPAPNGDFMGWFPDYFGKYNIASSMTVEDIEVIDFVVNWNDQQLYTHVFVSGAVAGFSNFESTPEQAVNAMQKYLTQGIVSVEVPEVLQSLLGLDKDDPRNKKFLDSQSILQRYGARPMPKDIGIIAGGKAEFWYACFLFMEQWTNQFGSSVKLTFMPELWPGMLLRIPSLRFQAYVQQVVHSGDYDSGFSTTVTVSSPAWYEETKDGLLGKSGMWDPARIEQVRSGQAPRSI